MKKIKEVEKKKKTARGLLIFAGILAVLLVLTFISGYFNVFYAQGSKQKLEDVAIAAQLLENGDLHITETWVLNMKSRGKPYTNGYKSFSSGGFDGIKDLTVYDHDLDVSYTFLEGVYYPEHGSYPSNSCYIVDDEYGYDYEVGWFFEPIDKGVRTFTFSYTMTNIATVYSDTGELYVGFIGSRFSIPIKNLSITLALPRQPQNQNPLAWLHTVSNGEIEIVDPTTITVQASNISPQTMVECRILLDKESLSDSNKLENYPSMEQIKEVESGYFVADDVTRSFAAFIVIASIGLLVFSFVPLKFFSKAKRHEVETPEYLREVPAHLSLGAARTLYRFYENKPALDVNGEFISALVLSLVQKGWLTVETDEGKKKNNTVITVLVNGHEPISTEEKPLWDVFFAVAQKHGGSFTMEQYAAYGRKEYTTVDAAMRRISVAIKESFSKHHWVEGSYFWKRPSTWIGLGMLALSIVVRYLGFENFGVLVVCLRISGLIWLVQGLLYRRLTPEGEREYKNLHALKNYLTNFTIIGERAPREVILWEGYLIYATLMDCAAQVRKSMPFPGVNAKDHAVVQSANNYVSSDYDSSTRDFGMSHSSGSSFRAFSSIGDSLSRTFKSVSDTASNLARPSGGGSGGGGGGSSSGGGGSGGGGGVR